MRTLIAVSLLCTLIAAPAAADEPRGLENVLEGLKSKDRAVRLQAARDAAGMQDSKLVRPLGKLLKDDEDDIRAAAIEALGKRTVAADQKKAAAALIARVPRNGGSRYASERLAILDALHDLARRETIKPLLDGVTRDTDLDEARARLTAVANVPHADAIERLITFLDKGKRAESRDQRNLAMQALRYATGVKMNRDADRWRAWWREAKENFDFEAAKQARAAATQAADEKREKKAERRRRKKDGEGKKQKKGEDA